MSPEVLQIITDLDNQLVGLKPVYSTFDKTFFFNDTSVIIMYEGERKNEEICCANAFAQD